MAYRLLIYNDSWTDQYELAIDRSKTAAIDLPPRNFTALMGGNPFRSFFTYNIEIWDNPKNARKLGFAADLNMINIGSIRGKALNAIIEVGFFVFKGRFTINNYKRDRGQNTGRYIGQLVGGVRNWTRLLPVKVNEIDLGRTLFSIDRMTELFDYNIYTGEPATYSLKYKGLPRSPIYQADGVYYDYVNKSYFRPDIFIGAIVDAIQDFTGVYIRSNLFLTEWFRHQITQYTGTGSLKYVGLSTTLNNNLTIAGGVSNPLLTLFNTADWATNNYTITYNASSPSFPFEELHLSGGIWYAEDSNVEFAGNIKLVSGSGYIAFARIQNSATRVLYRHPITSVGDNIFSFFIDDWYTRGFQIYLEGDMVVEAGTTFEIILKSSQTDLEADVPVILNSCISKELKTLEMLNGMSDNWNLVWFFDEQSNQVICDPKWDVSLPTGEFVAGFYRSIAHSENWTERIDGTTEDINFKPYNVNRTLHYRFKDDGDDTITTESTFEHIETLSDKYKVGEKKQENAFFAATVTRQLPLSLTPYTETNIDGIIPVVPWMIAYDETEESPNYNPEFNFVSRLLYKVGEVTGHWRFGETGFKTTYPYACQVDDSRGINLGYVDTNNAKGLVSLFYLQDIEMFNRAIKKTVKGLISPRLANDLLTLFRTPKYIENNVTGNGHYIIDTPRIVLNKNQIAKISFFSTTNAGTGQANPAPNYIDDFVAIQTWLLDGSGMWLTEAPEPYLLS